MPRWPLILAALYVIKFAVAPAHGEPTSPLIGVASVIDGDTIEIHGERVRLVGIDAPESSQLCANTETGEAIPCGRRAAFFLADLLARQTVSCAPTGLDRYRRTLAHCEVQGEDIGRAMVRAGWSLSFVRYSREYDPDEAIARSTRAGLWSMEFLPPWEFRATIRPTGSRQP
jgi:endonuclease YncB( thermonuclease family)